MVFWGAFGDEGFGFADAFDFDAGGVEAEGVEEPVADGGGAVDAEGEVVLFFADGVGVAFEDEFGVFALHDEGAEFHEAEAGFVFEFGAVEFEEDVGGDPDGFAGVAFAFHAEDLVEAGVAFWDEVAWAISAAAFGEVGDVGGAVFEAAEEVAEEVADVHFRVVGVERVGPFVHALENLGDVLGGIVASAVGRVGERFGFGFGSGGVEGEVFDLLDGGGHLDFSVDEEVCWDVAGVEFGEFGDFFGREVAVFGLALAGIDVFEDGAVEGGAFDAEGVREGDLGDGVDLEGAEDDPEDAVGGDGEDERGHDPEGDTQVGASAADAGTLPMKTVANHGDLKSLK